MKDHGLSIVRACQLVTLSRTAWYRRPQSSMERDAEVIDALNQLVARKPRWGFWKLHDRLRLDGLGFNHKRLHRVYCAMGLNLPRRTRKRLPVRPRRPLAAAMELNRTWALDFMSDALYGRRPFRTLNVIDEANREALGIEVATSIPSARVIRVMEQLIEMHFIQPGKPDQNAFIERFNKTYREEVLDAYVFDSIEQVRDVTQSWLRDYNQERPHDSLGCVPPLSYMPRQNPTGESASKLCA